MPEPGAFEVIVRVMAAGVNYNNVWAALGKPVSVMRYGDHPRVRPPHRWLGRFGHRLEGRPRGDPLEARRRGRRALQPGLLRGPRGARTGPDGSALPEDLGLRDDLGLVRPVHQGPGPAAAAQAPGADLGGGRVLRARVLHRLADADDALQTAGGQHRPDLGRRGRPRGVRHPALQGRRGALRRRRLIGREGRAGQAPGRRGLHRPRRVRRDDAHGRARPPRRRPSASGLRAASPSASRRSSATLPTSSSSTSAKRPSPPPCSPSSRSGKSSSAPAPPASTWTSTWRYLWMTPEGDPRLALRQRL